MQRILKIGFAIITVMALLATMGPGAAMARDMVTEVSPAGGTMIVVTVNGLEQGEEATVTLSAEGATDSVLFTTDVLGDGTTSQTLDLPGNLEGGYYQLTLNAPEKYFREPKGYFFMVNQSTLVNPTGHVVVFTLIPPSDRDYQPYRGPLILPGGDKEPALAASPEPVDVIYRVESMISLSAPPRVDAGESPEAIDSEDYDWNGADTWHDNDGVRARIGVVNPGVRHDYTLNEFVVARVMSTGGQSLWIETGWAEVSWQGDTRYLYQYDTVYSTWRLVFSLQDGNSIDVRVRRTTGSTWVSEYWNGSYWVETGYVGDLGFTNASGAENMVEIWAADANNPNVPATYTYDAYLNITGTWTQWDYGTFWFYTTLVNESPYDGHYTNLYYYFYIHTH